MERFFMLRGLQGREEEEEEEGTKCIRLEMKTTTSVDSPGERERVSKQCLLFSFSSRFSPRLARSSISLISSLQHSQQRDTTFPVSSSSVSTTPHHHHPPPPTCPSIPNTLHSLSPLPAASSSTSSLRPVRLFLSLFFSRQRPHALQNGHPSSTRKSFSCLLSGRKSSSPPTLPCPSLSSLSRPLLTLFQLPLCIASYRRRPRSTHWAAHFRLGRDRRQGHYAQLHPHQQRR